MPIKDKTVYPANWKQISLRIRERDGWRCKWCDAENGKPNPRTGSIVVLTTAHVNHDTTDNSDANLAALCQRCHLRHDAQYHASNAARTRRAKRVSAGQMEIEL